MARIFDIAGELERAQQRPRGLRPELPVPFPGAQFRPFGHLFGSNPASWVSEMQVLGLPSAWRAVNLIANGVASMAPMKTYDADGIRETEPPNVCTRPNAMWTCFDFFHMAVATALMRGNFVGLLADFDAFGYPRQVIPLPTQLVVCRYDGDGQLEYNFQGKPYTSLDVVHVRAFATPESPWGIGVVENFRRSLNLALEQQALAADTYARGSVPSGTLTVDRPTINDKQAEDVQNQWIEKHGGNAAPAVLPKGWTFQPLTWSPEDAQFLQSRQFSVAEMALMFNLDPTDLGAAIGGSSITYQNTEQAEIGRLVNAYDPWVRRFEQAWSDLIPSSTQARFVPENRLRLDAKTRAEVHQLNIASGVETVDEAREADGREPVPETPQQEAQEQKAGEILYDLEGKPVVQVPPVDASAIPGEPPKLPAPTGAPDLVVKPQSVKV